MRLKYLLFSLVLVAGSVLQSAQAQLVTVKGATISIKNGGAAWTGVWCDGTVDINSGTISNDGILTTTATYQIDAGATSSGSGLYKVAVNWSNSGTFTAPGSGNRSTVDMNGSSAQSFTGTSITTFNNIIFSGGGTKTLNQVEKIDSQSTYTSGVVSTTQSNLLMYTVNAVAFSGGSSTSYVNGPCSKDFPNAYAVVGSPSTQEFIYPVGKNARFNKSGFLPATSSSLTMRTEYFGMPTPYNPLTPVQTPIILVSPRHYWYFDPINSTTLASTGSGSGQVRLYWISGDYDFYSSSITNTATLTTARWTGVGGGTPASTWVNTGNAAVSGNITAGNIQSQQTSTWLTPNEPFTIATTTTDNALPVELGGFAANQSANKVKLDWFTYSEIQNLGFEIERADLGENGVIASYKNNQELAAKSDRGAAYEITDQPTKDGIYTYYLYQIDINGLRKQIATSTVNYSVSLPKDYLVADVFPNPSQLNASLRIGLQEASTVSVFIYDNTGRLVSSVPAATYDNGYHVVPLHVEGLPSGTYNVVTIAGGKQTSKSLVIMR